MNANTQTLLDAIKGLSLPAVPPAPPVDRDRLAAALQRSMESPATATIFNKEGRPDGTRDVNRVAWFKMRDKDVSIRSTNGSLFDMPLHVDADQALRVLNLDFALEVEMDVPEEPDSESTVEAANVDDMKMPQLRALAEKHEMKFRFGASLEEARGVLRDAGIGG